MSELKPIERKRINEIINELETITHFKHHYVRKTGLKKAIKETINEILYVRENTNYDIPPLKPVPHKKGK